MRSDQVSDVGIKYGLGSELELLMEVWLGGD